MPVKKIFLLFVVILLFSSCLLQKQKPINGIMIDCSRLLEKHEYYYRLIDFMSDWDMNTLLLHFSDDHGIAVKLPGFEKLAMPHAFTRDEMIDLIEYADKKGIEVIPELEVFGHTRYITDHPDFHHLYVGDRSGKIVFNALDPTKPETVELMHSMIREVAALFSSEYLHLGCDEVNLDGLGLKDKEKEARIWADYVNKMISIARDQGKIPMIWSDHIQKDKRIAELLDKDIVLMEWNYAPEYKPRKLQVLQEMGYKEIIMCPSVSCWRNRIIPSKPQLKNVDGHAEALREGTARGLINTVWLPMRYLQNSMWYGMAYSAFLVNSSKPMNFKKFHRMFSAKTFGFPLDDEMNTFLNAWTELHLDRRIYSAIANNNYEILKDPKMIQELEKVRSLSSSMIKNRITVKPKKNLEILESMLLSTEIMYVLSEGLLIILENDISDQRTNGCIELLDDVIDRVSIEWDKGRFPDDPAKYHAKFPNQTNSHLLIMLRKLNQQLIGK